MSAFKEKAWVLFAQVSSYLTFPLCIRRIVRDLYSSKPERSWSFFVQLVKEVKERQQHCVWLRLDTGTKLEEIKCPGTPALPGVFMLLTASEEAAHPGWTARRDGSVPGLVIAGPAVITAASSGPSPSPWEGTPRCSMELRKTCTTFSRAFAVLELCVCLQVCSKAEVQQEALQSHALLLLPPLPSSSASPSLPRRPPHPTAPAI